MPGLESYDKTLLYSYALGIFPATECLKKAAGRCLRLLVSSDSGESKGVAALRAAAEAEGIRCETADRLLRRLSGKGNCHAAMVYRKQEGCLDPAQDHILLHHPTDAGNMGTILRTALGFGFRQIAVVRPAVDTDDPHTVRASMGACFSLQIAHYDTYAAYRAAFPNHAVYPFMLTGSSPLPSVATSRRNPATLVFGNEAAGLPEFFADEGTSVRIPHGDDIDSLNLAVAAAIGMYAFSMVSGGVL